MKPQAVVSPEDQSVTFIELFFDLVFVFSVTQVVSFFHHGVDWISVGQAVLVFWLVWWGWTQFTWALNAADTTHHLVGIGVLIATAVAFFMAIALPEAFQDRSLWFAMSYVLVRVIGLAVYAWVASENPTQRAAVRIFTLVSAGGLIAVLVGGFVGGTTQYWFWGFAIVLDVIAAAVGGQMEGWNLHADHFGERHGLFVIIALGETLIVAAGGVTEAVWTNDLLAVAVLAVAVTCGLWWSYFSRVKAVLDQALASRRGTGQTKMGRDVFSLIHFPMICGVIAYAVSIEEAVAHPDEPLSLVGRGALALGLVLFVGGAAGALWRAARRLLLPRVILTAGTAVIVVAVTGVSAPLTLAITLVGILTIAVFEHRAKS
ncbi:MAG: low temperature requirement protein A [Rhodothermales bacterium]